MEGTPAYVTLFAGYFRSARLGTLRGPILSIAQNTALFSLLGTTYGGNGQTTFALPDLRGRQVVGAGRSRIVASMLLASSAQRLPLC